jgi:hypothetical protein
MLDVDLYIDMTYEKGTENVRGVIESERGGKRGPKGGVMKRMIKTMWGRKRQ